PPADIHVFQQIRETCRCLISRLSAMIDSLIPRIAGGLIICNCSSLTRRQFEMREEIEYWQALYRSRERIPLSYWTYYGYVTPKPKRRGINWSNIRLDLNMAETIIKMSTPSGAALGETGVPSILVLSVVPHPTDHRSTKNIGERPWKSIPHLSRSEHVYEYNVHPQPDGMNSSEDQGEGLRGQVIYMMAE
ncbi:1925_t:CDS:2, partial [Acaulospora colombiana]